MDARRALRKLGAVPRWLLGLAIIAVFVAIALHGARQSYQR